MRSHSAKTTLARARRAWVLAIALLLSLSSCVTATRISEINALYREALVQRANEYRIKPGDTLKIELSTLEQRDLDQSEVKVRADGRADIFFLPNHLLAGKTIDEVRSELEEKVRAQIRDAEVSIQVTPAGEKVYMVGQFERPATLDLTPNMTLAEAVSAVGGTRITGDTDDAVLRRPFGDPENPERFRIDIEEGGEQLLLLPGDQIELKRTWFATVTHWLQEYIFFIFDFRIVYGLDAKGG
jgi:polysaccharide export outer membrane protein